MSPAAQKIVDALKHNLLSFNNEARLHEAISQILIQADFSFKHEYALSARDRIDYYIEAGGIGIEAKVKGSDAQVLRQLSRYTESVEIQELIVVTARMSHRFPSELGGKPLITCRIIRSLC